jgi:L,D-transpeptidase YcbB
MSDSPASLSTSLSQTVHAQDNQQTDNNSYIIPALVTREDQALQDLYFLAHSPLLWLNADNPDAAVYQILALLKTAEEQGLSSRDYNTSTLEARWQTLQNTPQSESSELVHFDTELSRNLLRFLSDLHWGRDVPQRIASGLNKPLNYELLVKALLKTSSTGDIAALSSQIEPNLPAYQLLKHTLHHFRTLPAEATPFDIQILSSIEPGDINSQIPLLRQKLTAFGLLKTTTEDKTPQTNFYDSSLISAVQKFQRLHGLAEDGVIGRKTVAALNTPITQRIQQLELGMERLRWLLSLKKDEMILVNIPAFRLWAFRNKPWPDSDDFSMKVVVGIAGKEQTPVFTADLAYLVFRPYWNVPDSIAQKEILPALENNPNYLDHHNMEFVQSFRNNAEPQQITPDTITLFRQGNMKVRQRPGGKNALGLVKFIFPNSHAIYLHDTPAKSLFKSDRRDFSHGCIRVEQPMALAEYILHSDRNWGQQKIRMAMKKGENQWVHLDDPVTVMVFYSTVQAIGDEVYFFDDIYGYDAALIQALNGENPTTALAVSNQILP